MTKREFASMLAEEAKKMGMNAEEDYIFRADGGTYIAVILKTEPGIPAPRIPVDGLFEALESGMPLEKVKADFVEKAKIANEMTLNGVNEKVLDWGWAKERVILRLVPADRKEYLAGCVHRTAADLAAVCSVMISDEAATTVTPSLLEAWKVTEEELFQTGTGNTGPVVSDIGDFMGLTGGGPATMTVLTNRLGRFGAGAVLCEGIQEQLDAIYPEGSYLLPSSIHEWIAVGNDNDPDWLKRMVKDINRTVLCPQDILSDNVYTLERGVLKVVC